MGKKKKSSVVNTEYYLKRYFKGEINKKELKKGVLRGY